MSLIEQAAKRLDELRRAGIEVRETPVPPARGEEPRRAEAAGEMPSRATRATSIRKDIDLASLAANGFVTPDSPRSRTAEEFRVIKRPLIANAAGKSAGPIADANLIMVTSSIPGEGKTFCSVNLAMSIAMELDRTVLLVDADVARPALPRTLGLPEMPGLLDVLQDSSLDLSQVLVRTNVDKLSFLSSGMSHPRAAEMLASDAMSRLLREVSTRYDDRLVIFDSPPLLVTTEARALAARMGQVVFVVQSDHTIQADVERALATIEQCPVKMVVLNKASTPSAAAYGYGYGYGYGA